MRNVFDQYSQFENKLTHALFSALQYDRALLIKFLRKFYRLKLPAASKDIRITVQTYPNKEPLDEVDLEKHGIPDAWIYGCGDWALLVEAKVTSPLSMDQLVRHKRTAQRLGFEKIDLMTLTVAEPTNQIKRAAITVFWKDIYAWLYGLREAHEWARHSSEYFETLEAQLIQSQSLTNGALTKFTGFFAQKQEYTYLEAKRLLGLALTNLRLDQRLIGRLDIDKESTGRGAITGTREDAVWDFIPLVDARQSGIHTSNPHLTLGVSRTGVDVTVTIANSINTKKRNRLRKLGNDGFVDLCEEITRNLCEIVENEPTAVPIMRGIQRRYPSQRSKPFIDALLEFDLRTAFPLNQGPKKQPQWIAAAFDTFDNKRSNYQLQIGMSFPIGGNSKIATIEALDIIARSWLACRPIIVI